MITILWFGSLPVLVLFLIRRGLKAMPQWHRYYVLIGIPAIALGCVIATAERLGIFVGVPEDSLIIRITDVLFDVYLISVFWGVLVGFSQTWKFLVPTRASSSSRAVNRRR